MTGQTGTGGWRSAAAAAAAGEPDVDLNGFFETYVQEPPAGSQPGPRPAAPGPEVSCTAAARGSAARDGEQPGTRPRHDAAALLGGPATGGAAPAREGLRGVLNRCGLRLKPAGAEQARRRQRLLVCSDFAGAMTVVVANPDGGSGKTPTVAALAGALGQARGGGVVAWDNNELSGALSLRTAAGGRVVTVRDMLRADRPGFGERREDVDGYLRHQMAGQYKVLASADGGDVLVSAGEYQRVHELLTRYYPLLVIDTGNNTGADNWRAAIASADQIVVPIKWKAVSCQLSAKMLQDLQEWGYEDLVARAVIVATNGPGDASSRHRARYHDYFAARAAALLEIPTDPHIHADGVIEHDALHPHTGRALHELAAAVAEGLLAAPRAALSPGRNSR